MDAAAAQQTPPPPSQPPRGSPARGIAAPATAPAGGDDVTRSTSIESHDRSIGCGSAASGGGSHGHAGGGYVASGGSVGGGSHATGGGSHATGGWSHATGGSVQGGGCSLGGGGGGSQGGGSHAAGGCHAVGCDASTVASHRSGSFRSSPCGTPRSSTAAAGGNAGAVPPFPSNSNVIAAAATPRRQQQMPAGVAPPPWPTSGGQQQHPQQQHPQQQHPQQQQRQPSPTRSSPPTSHETAPSHVHFRINPNAPPPTLSLSTTNSGDALFGNVPPGSWGVPPNAAVHATADSSVLLGLEELERQQADVEKRRAEAAAAAERQRRERQRGGPPSGGPPSGGPPSGGLPPLPPSSRPAAALPPEPASWDAPVPSQIHLREEDDDYDEDTVLGSEAAGAAAAGGDGGAGRNGNGNEKGDLRGVTSIERLRGQVSVGLRRFRSWSQDALVRTSMDNPAGAANSSTDSTQNTLGRGSNEGGGRGAEAVAGGAAGGLPVAGQPRQPQQQRQPSSLKSSGRKPRPDAPPSTSARSSYIVPEPYLDDDELKPLVYGYLRKLGRNGHWQKRFFESNGERLTYYKSVRRTRALATLDLCKVGEIAIDRTDPEECTFTIAVKSRPYYLRAEDKARRNDWVIILNRAREARMNVGNIQLAAGGDGVVGMASHRSQAGSDDYAPCIVISALRPRTRAVSNLDDNDAAAVGAVPDLLTSNSAEEQIEVMKWDGRHQQGVAGVADGIDAGGGATSPTQLAGAGESPQAMAKWQKRHSRMHTLSLRFLRWARSITHQADSCRREADVVVVPAHVVMAAGQTALLAVRGEGRATPPWDAAAGGKTCGMSTMSP